MVETITPAVCGTRRRQLIALGLFALGAVVASAALGALLGLAGSVVGKTVSLAVAVVLALVGAAREGGLLRFRIPQSRRQVPDRWRSELPLPVWATGYGAGLGLGVLTYQPVATFWVACAAAVALASPVAGAVAFALYGVGRTLVLLLPARRGADAVSIVEGLVGHRRTLLRANAVALAACACLLALSPVAGASVMPLGSGRQLDPSASRSGFAFTRSTGPVASPTFSVDVRANGRTLQTFANAEQPSLQKDLLAYRDTANGGIKVVRWRTGAMVRSLSGNLSKPALQWPRIVYVQGGQLMLRNMQTGSVRRIGRADDDSNIGRPSISGDRIVWHISDERGTKIVMYRISSRKKTVPVRTKIALLSNPSVSSTHMLWLRELKGRSEVFIRALRTGKTKRIGTISSQSLLYWTTDLYGRTAFVTRWRLNTGIANILRIRF
ncbi:MAG TPA: hypothetical protein VH306_02740 [Gaiellaceae bacterium]|jgi:hypothetical protein